MNKITSHTACAIVLLACFAQSQAQSVPTGLVGCLDPNGSLFNVVPVNTPRDQCPQGTTSVQLGSLSNIDVGASLISKIEAGNAFLDINPDLAVPPSCPPGQVALSDDNGGWVCTPPNFAGKKNPASKVWVVPQVDRCVNGVQDTRRPRIQTCRDSLSYTEVAVVNPGLEPASLTCYFFSRGGVLFFDHVQTSTIGPGGLSQCQSPPVENGSSEYYEWALIVSDQGVLPTVRSFWESILSRAFAVQSSQIETYPVDCSEPEGHEFVCQFSQ
jgi:hypothetical protein